MLQLKVCPKSQCISLCVVTVEGVPEESCISTVAVRTDLYNRDPAQVLITDFFGSVPVTSN